MKLKGPMMVLIALLSTGEALAQRPAFWPDTVRSEFVETATLKMQVYRAGESGIPVVIMQDMHDYFDPAPKWDDPQMQAGWIAGGAGHRDFVAKLGERYQVLAPIRRGYGETEDPGSGYDVATTGRDLIALLNASGIEQAIFVGRTPSQNEMIWLAENHPERMAGMVLLDGMVQPLVDLSNPDFFAFASGWWRGSRDLASTDERIDQLTSERLGGYIPAFLSDESITIDVPTLYLEGPAAFEGQWMWSNLYRFERRAVEQCVEITEAYPCSVFGDAERVARLDALFDNHPMQTMVAGGLEKMQEQFSDFTVSNYPHGQQMVSDFWGDYLERIQPFLNRIEAEFGSG
ncbi:MAG: alpha/beta fold hydrolase [Wenzhouxiangella sp.]|jgi:pimeloyl-ACP methyl ester carboxylesterase|nr:alpha/beta fold hydrolase [Wenzhouxiangella sp.]